MFLNFPSYETGLTSELAETFVQINWSLNLSDWAPPIKLSEIQILEIQVTFRSTSDTAFRNNHRLIYTDPVNYQHRSECQWTVSKSGSGPRDAKMAEFV